jgi:mannose-6-phosphate isomerase-like protein (cupin superfamily)
VKLLLIVMTGMLAAACAPATRIPPNLHHFKVVLDAAPRTQMLLTGPPQTAGMRSGRVVLKPGEAMHRHSTKLNEEILVFLQGKARVVLGSEPVMMEAGQILYVPPQTEHEVHNDGPEELRYIFTVAPAAR